MTPRSLGLPVQSIRHSSRKRVHPEIINSRISIKEWIMNSGKAIINRSQAIGGLIWLKTP
jgi:hypothetical protein